MVRVPVLSPPSLPGGGAALRHVLDTGVQPPMHIHMRMRWRKRLAALTSHTHRRSLLARPARR